MSDWTEVEHADDCMAILYRRVGSEEIMVVPQLYNVAIRRGEYMGSTWRAQW